MAGDIPTIDGVTVAVDDRVLLTAQSDKSQNGIYTVTSVGDSTGDEDKKADGEDVWRLIRMCLTGKKYFVHLHSSQGTPLAGAPNAKAEMRYSSVRLNDILRDEDHSIEYFRVKVEFFSMYLPLGSRQTAIAIHSPQRIFAYFARLH